MGVFLHCNFRSFYKCQDELIKSFETIRYEIEEDKIDMTKLRKTVSRYAKLTFFANLVSTVVYFYTYGRQNLAILDSGGGCGGYCHSG